MSLTASSLDSGYIVLKMSDARFFTVIVRLGSQFWVVLLLVPGGLLQ